MFCFQLSSRIKKGKGLNKNWPQDKTKIQRARSSDLPVSPQRVKKTGMFLLRHPDPWIFRRSFNISWRKIKVWHKTFRHASEKVHWLSLSCEMDCWETCCHMATFCRARCRNGCFTTEHEDSEKSKPGTTAADGGDEGSLTSSGVVRVMFRFGDEALFFLQGHPSCFG